MNEFNSEVVIKTLQLIINILKAYNIQYRILGSVATASINGKLYRKIGDLDIIIDLKGRDNLCAELKSLGYEPAGGIYTFARKYLSLDQIVHPTLLDIGLFCGTWQPDGSFIIGNKRVGFNIEAYALKETNYQFYGIEFVGIPLKAVATGIYASKTNPKRKKELFILKERGIEPYPNTYIHVYFFGLNIDWVYKLIVVILNIIGYIRVNMGLAFDPWR